MRKKVWIVGLIIAIWLVSSVSLGFAQKVTIKYWGMKQAEVRLIEAQQSALVDFEKKYPEIKVKITVFPYEAYRDKLLVATAAGTPPDVSVIDQIWSAEFPAAGFVIPLDKYIAKSKIVKRDAFFPGAWDSAVYKGKVWGIPFDVGVWAFVYYNRDMFRKAGLDPNKPPVYWDELLEYGKLLTRDTNGDGEIDQWGLPLYGAKDEATICTTDAFIFSNGGSILSRDFSKCVLGNKASVDALKFYKSLQKISPPGAVSRTAEDAFKIFTAGKAAMHLYGEWGQDTVNARAPEMDWAMGFFPKPHGGKSIGTFGGWNMVIYKKSEHKDQAWKFIEYWTSKGVNEKVAALTPANKASANILLALKRRFPKMIFKQLTESHPRPISPVYPQISDVQRDAIQYILLGTKTVKEALDDAAKKIDEIIK